ncbi:MAG TPA: hypothetical protein VJ499_02985 [Flavisolibacter sp.]|nr:hypothetical protein [Flavisolibacter sp.]
MNGWDNPGYVLALIISNIIALVIYYFARKIPRLARLLFFFLFAWAAFTNWNMAMNRPQEYLSFADLAFLGIYKNFINGWFSQHAALLIAAIALGQLLIALSMLWKGWVFKLGTIGGIIFLVAIIPLGVGSGFPFPIITAMAFYLLYRQKNVDVLWKGPKSELTAPHQRRWE